MSNEITRVVRYFERNIVETDEEKRRKEQNLIRVIKMQYNKSRAYFNENDVKTIPAQQGSFFSASGAQQSQLKPKGARD